MEPIVGTLQLFAFDFTPENWLLCDGATYNTAAQPELWETIGPAYGGDGRSFFKVPDLTNQSPVKGSHWCICNKGTLPVRQR